MSDNFSNVPFPVTGTTFDLKISYQININSKEKRRLTLPLKFSVVENKLPTSKPPSVSDLYEEFDRFVLKRLLAILGKNVQLTALTLKSSGLSFLIPLYRFGLMESNSLPVETALFFLLQPYNKSTNYRLYLKGCSSNFSQKPLPPSELSLIQDFESLFTSNLVYLDGLLVLKILRNTDELISATFRELKRFLPRKSRLSPKKAVKKVKKRPLRTRAKRKKESVF
jgi:hypothetical protein